MTAIEVNNYQVSYNEGAEPILQDCSLTLDYGEFVLLSGLSGSGKSTLLSSINGIIPGAVFGIQQGDIMVDGESIRGKKISEIARKVGQRPSERGQPDCAWSAWRTRLLSAARTGISPERKSGRG